MDILAVGTRGQECLKRRKSPSIGRYPHCEPHLLTLVNLLLIAVF
jgi:hypothetical protein